MLSCAHQGRTAVGSKPSTQDHRQPKEDEINLTDLSASYSRHHKGRKAATKKHVKERSLYKIKRRDHIHPKPVAEDSLSSASTPGLLQHCIGFTT